MIYNADWVIPVTGTPIRNGYVEIAEDGTIVSVSDAVSCPVEAVKLNGILAPGFTNCHCHIELSHLKGLFKQGTGMDGFIQQINALRTSIDRPGRLDAIDKEMESLYNQGVSAMADISNCDESFAAKASSKIYTRTFLEVFGTEPEDATAIVANAIELQKKASEYGLDAAPTPHSCYTMSPLLNRLSAAEGLKSGYISYHSQESDQENDMIRYGKGELFDDYHARGCSMPPVMGISSLEYFIRNLSEAVEMPVEGNVILVHNVDTDQVSIDAALKAFKHPYWALCPLSNIFIHRQLPPIGLLRQNGLKICIGTDSLSSNTQLSMIAEMKCIQDNFPDIPLEEIVKWATLNGAEAVGKNELLGSFIPGKKPGVVLIENVDIENLKLTDTSFSRRLA